MPQSARFAQLANHHKTKEVQAARLVKPASTVMRWAWLARHAKVGFIVEEIIWPIIQHVVLAHQATSKTSKVRARVCLASLACMVGLLA